MKIRQPEDEEPELSMSPLIDMTFLLLIYFICTCREEEEASVKAKVWADENIRRITEGRNIVKEIYVKGRIYTIVVK